MKQRFHILHSIGAKVYTTVKILHWAIIIVLRG